MVTVGMDYDVLPGQEAAFERTVREVLARLEAAPGHTRTRLYRDVDRPASYLIHSEWSDRAAFLAFTHSDAFAQVTRRGRDEMLAGPPRHRILTEG